MQLGGSKIRPTTMGPPRRRVGSKKNRPQQRCSHTGTLASAGRVKDAPLQRQRRPSCSWAGQRPAPTTMQRPHRPLGVSRAGQRPAPTATMRTTCRVGVQKIRPYNDDATARPVRPRRARDHAISAVVPLVGRAMDAPISFVSPALEVRFEGCEALKREPGDRVALDVADARLGLALGAGLVGSARGDLHAPVPAECSEGGGGCAPCPSLGPAR